MWGESVNTEPEPAVNQQGRPCRGTASFSLVSFTSGNFRSEGHAKIWGSSFPTTEPIVPPSYCRTKAKNDTCFIVSSFQKILWIWNFICLVSIHHVLSVKFQLVSVSSLGKYAKIYPNAVTVTLHAISSPTTGSWKGWGMGGSFHHQDHFAKC